MIRRALLLQCLFAVFARGQDGSDSERRCRALSALADRGGFDVAAAVAALNDGDEGLARTAAAIVRHEWLELPDELFVALDGKPLAVRRLLDELARAPRPAAAAWVQRQAQARPKRSLDHRLLALAARGEALTVAEAGLLLEALKRGEDGDGFHLVLSLLPAKVADALLGRLHQGLRNEEFGAERIAYLLDRLSPRGTKSLLGLVVTLPEATALVLCRHVYHNRPELVRERVAAALDRTTPFEALWLEFAGPALDRPARIERVLAVLRDSDSAAVRDRAFEALLDAKVVDEAMLKVAVDQGDDVRIRRVLMKAAGQVPPARLAAWLRDGSAEVAAATAKALTRFAVLPPQVQQALLAMLRDAEVVDAGAALDALTAVVQSGDAVALTEVWPKIFSSRSWSVLLDRLGHREEPYIYELLLAELVTGGGADADERARERQLQLDMVRLLLVGKGDRRELETLVARAPASTPTFLRRCRHYANPLPTKFVQPLIDAALAAEDPDLAAELLEWVATNQESAPGRLLQLWRDPPDVPAQEELREIALRVTAMGSRRSSLVGHFRRAVAEGPLPEHMASLPYELLNSMREPMSFEDGRLCASILLLPPLSDPESEQRLVRRWPDGSFGFPLVAAVAARMRGTDPGSAFGVFRGVVDGLLRDPRSSQISRQRLKVFWRSLARTPGLMRPVGAQTARLWAFHAGDDEDVVGDGAALWLSALLAEHDRDYVRAEQLHRRAIAGLLRLSATRQEARWLLGDRDPGAGDDPWAALSAAPHRMRYLAAKKAGDARAMAAASALVREFAGHDQAAPATLIDPPPESGR